MKTKIKKIGFEIEGEFSDAFEQRAGELGEMKSDGSIHSCQSSSLFHKKYGELSLAEYNSPALELDKMKEIRQIFREFDIAWKKGEYHWNASAGFHVHVSFSPEKPPELFSEAFARYFYANMQRRFRGAYNSRKDRSYCKAIVSNSDILHGGDRYRGINFLPSFRERKTIEFRIFPTARPLRMYSFLLFTIDTIKNFSAMELKIPFTIESPENNREETKEYVDTFSLREALEQTNDTAFI